MFTKKRIEDIIGAGTDMICVSLQGMSAKKYTKVCGREIACEAFVETLSYLYNYSREKCKINIKIADVALEKGDEEKFIATFGIFAIRFMLRRLKLYMQMWTIPIF